MKTHLLTLAMLMISLQFAVSNSFRERIEKKSKISGQILLKDCKSVLVKIHYYYTSDPNFLHVVDTLLVLKDYKFNLSVPPQKDFFYIDIMPVINDIPLPTLEDVQSFLIEPGDSLYFDIEEDKKIIVTGKGSLKNQLEVDFQKVTKYTGKVSVNGSDQDTSHMVMYEKHLDSLFNNGLEMLKKFKPNLSKQVYDILKCDLVLERRYFFIYNINSITLSGNPTRIKFYYDLFKRTYQDKDVPSDIGASKMFSKRYAEYLTACLILKARMMTFDNPEAKSRNIDSVYHELLKNYTGLVQEKMIIAFLNSIRYNYSINDYINQTNGLVKNKLLIKDLQKLNEMDLAKKIGEKIFPFELADSSGVIFDNSIFNGKLTFVDFWYTGCGACANAKRELTQILDSLQQNNKNFQVITISTDENKDDWKMSLKKGIYTHENSINLNAAITHPFLIHYGVATFPTFFIVNKSGKLVSIPKSWKIVETMLSQNL